ncbi:cell shape-determining protein MreC [Xylanibacillus composti]|uniref:Cell shape-determining protein MreC n=1 Tax=Xylanibacillus composti TaxID=1572762 RepID=A0A8J4M3J6_9BACL|nr:rod shape-determining protein MreC [Xylanibacillus composti]GIQ70175.1 cell shape-determining protein MreC [Xylanibacillus composti]
MKFMGNKRLFILLFALIFFIAIMGLTRGVREPVTWPEKFLNDTVSWTQGLIYKPAGMIAGFFQDIGELRRIHAENEALKRTLTRYAGDVARLNALEEENGRLQDALAFTERQKQSDKYMYRLAKVVAVSPDTESQTIKIDLGSNDGIEVDWAVVTPEGFIGRVTRVTPFFSYVQPYTSIDDKAQNTKGIAVTVRENQDSFGVIENFDRSTGELIMSKISSQDALKAGDTVVTSDFGHVFPAGLVIGTVEHREVGEGLTHIARIKPAASLEHLREVFVVEVPWLEEVEE